MQSKKVGFGHHCQPVEADLKSQLVDLVENRDPFKDLEFASATSNTVHVKHHHFKFLCSDRSLCKRILNIQILRSNVSSRYICYKWVVVKHVLISNLALM